MKLTLVALITVYGLAVLAGNFAHAATVSCQVKEVSGSQLILENCDTKRVQDFKKGNKVKVKLQTRKK